MGTSPSHHIFQQNYCDKKYTKDDLNNPLIFDINKIERDSQFLQQWQPQNLELIKECVEVVRENPEQMTLELKGETDKTIVYGLNFGIQLHNTQRDVTYYLESSDRYYNNQVFMTVSNERPYSFFHHSNIRIYFRGLHGINNSKL